MQNKRRIIAALCILLMAVCGMGFAIAHSDDPWSWLGREQSQIDAWDEKDEIVAYVNGEAVTKGELLFWQNMVEYGNHVGSGTEQPTDAKTVFHEHVVPFKAAVVMAKKEGLWPTRAETEAHIAQVRQSFEVANEEVKEQFSRYLAALGLSEKEYFEEYAFENYREALAAGKYRERLALQLDVDGKAPHEVWDRIAAHLKEKAEVEVVHPLVQSTEPD